jgi:exodeoxyribonuclease VIII
MNPILPSVGIHPNVPPATYHSWNALSHSWLNKLRISPAHLADLIEHGYSDDDSSPTLTLGSAVHCRVLEPTEYEKRYAIRPEGQDGRSKVGKDFGTEAHAAGKTVLNCKEGRWCEAIAYRAKQNPLVHEWIQKSRDNMAKNTEVSLVWERDGHLCKARADLIVPELHIIADLKTTVTASQKGFALQVAKYHYHEQGAWYLDGLQRLTSKVWDFYFIACEKGRPFLVTAHQLVRDSPAHERAVAENDKLFELYRQCRTSRVWPGYGDSFEIVLPEWALTDDASETANVAEEPFVEEMF